MTLISENGKRSTGSKRKSVNPISPGEMMGPTSSHRGFGFFLRCRIAGSLHYAHDGEHGYVGVWWYYKVGASCFSSPAYRFYRITL